jgi:hypothetical protein
MTCAHACCYLYCIYTTRLLLRWTFWRLSWRVRQFLGEGATSRLPVETSFSAASTRFWFVYETFGHVVNVIILSISLDIVFWYALSHYVCVTWSWRIYILCIWFCLLKLGVTVCRSLTKSNAILTWRKIRPPSSHHVFHLCRCFRLATY